MATFRFIQPRTDKGQFARFESEIARTLEEEAKLFQEEVAAIIEEKILRPDESTGRLVEGTLAAFNRKVTPSTWRVGIPSELRAHELKYFRTIEEGSLAVWRHPFVGTPLKFNPQGFGPNAAGASTSFRSFSRGETKVHRVADHTVRFGGGTARNQAKSPRIVFVTHEIAPMHAYRDAFIAGGWQARILRDFSQSIGRNFLK